MGKYFPISSFINKTKNSLPPIWLTNDWFSSPVYTVVASRASFWRKETNSSCWCVQLTLKTSTSVQKCVHFILLVNKCKNPLENFVKGLLYEVLQTHLPRKHVLGAYIYWYLLKWPSVLALLGVSPDDGCQGRRKYQKIGGAPASRGTLGYWKGHLKNFSRKCWGGGGRKIFPSYHTEIARFWPNCFKKLGNFQTKRAPLMLI
jgi:hypothetical protein